MCMIICKKIGIEHPSQEVLETCSRANQDGIGIAYTNRGMVNIKKDFTDLGEYSAWAKTYLKVEDAYVLHFRKATAGLKDEGNRHPFPVTRKSKRLRRTVTTCDMAAAHNGTFKSLATHKKYSDSLLFVKHILSDPIVKNNLHTEAMNELINGYLDTSKLSIIDRLGNIINYGLFYAEWGLNFSNWNYKTAPSSSYQDHLREECMVCHVYKIRSDVFTTYIGADGPKIICYQCYRERPLLTDGGKSCA